MTYGATVVLTPLLLWMLARAFPARESSSLELQPLRARHKATQTWATVFAIVDVWAALFVMIFVHVGNTPWLVGVVLGSLVLVPVVVIAIRTLPRGLAEWQEFWRFHELHHRISLTLLAPLYAAIGLLGIVSTFVIITRQ